MTLRILAALAALALAAPASADVFEGREFETKVPEFRGIKANAPIPPGMHILNEGGSDGAGLCVISSVTLDGVYQDVPELRDGKRSLLWRTAKARRGGYTESKLERLFGDVGMKTPWLQVSDGVEEVAAVVRHYTERGVPCATTMNTGRRYQWQWIAHMVTTIHLDAEWACVVDNNFPGVYFWMPASEWMARTDYGGVGWTVVLLWRRAFASRIGVVVASALAAALAAWLLAAAAAVVATARRRAEYA